MGDHWIIVWLVNQTFIKKKEKSKDFCFIFMLEEIRLFFLVPFAVYSVGHRPLQQVFRVV